MFVSCDQSFGKSSTTVPQSTREIYDSYTKFVHVVKSRFHEVYRQVDKGNMYRDPRMRVYSLTAYIDKIIPITKQKVCTLDLQHCYDISKTVFLNMVSS